MDCGGRCGVGDAWKSPIFEVRDGCAARASKVSSRLAS
jgi:hypothetical protein